jgi:hypothetical protein
MSKRASRIIDGDISLAGRRHVGCHDRRRRPTVGQLIHQAFAIDQGNLSWSRLVQSGCTGNQQLAVPRQGAPHHLGQLGKPNRHLRGFLSNPKDQHAAPVSCSGPPTPRRQPPTGAAIVSIDSIPDKVKAHQPQGASPALAPGLWMPATTSG